MTADDWAMIGQFISDLKLINNGLASDAYKESVLESIRANSENDETIEELQKLAREI